MEQEAGCASEHVASGVHFQFTLQNRLRLRKTGHAKYLSHVQIEVIEGKRSSSRERHYVLFLCAKYRRFRNGRNATATGMQSWGKGLWEEHSPLLNPGKVLGQPTAPLNAKKFLNISP